MRVVIADDEPLARYSLRSMLEEMGCTIGAVREAADGGGLVDAVKAFAPDIVFADIRMPRLTGLDAIAELAHEFPQTVWIVVSAHDLFAYAQQAIRLGVFRYLLKPVDPRDLQTVMDEAEAEIKRRNRRLMTGTAVQSVTRHLTARILPVALDQLTESLRRVVAWTEHNYRKNVGLAQAAEESGLSVGYVSTRFREETGLTYLEFLTALRMETARRMLADPTAGVEQVARSVGYAGRRQFARRFQEYWGMSATTARRTET
jgi:two-component system, response regulator YesN